MKAIQMIAWGIVASSWGVAWPFNWHATLLNNLLAYYAFEWNANDSQWVYNWTVYWATPAAWLIWNAYTYDWINDYIDFGTTSFWASTSNTITISCWSNYTFWERIYILNNYWSSTTINQCLIYINPNWKIYVLQKQATGWLKYRYWNTTNALWTWVKHITVTMYPNNTAPVVYVNNVSQAMTLNASSWTLTMNTFVWSYNHVINRDAVALWNFYWESWYLDEMWIRNRAITTWERTDLYNSWSWLTY